MKSILFLMLLLAFTFFSAGQSPASPEKVQTGYLKKSKSQKTVAWVLLGGGGLLATAGLMVGMNQAVDDISNLFAGEQQKSSNTGPVLFYTGLAAMAGSIPFFIASSKNKKKAANLSASFKIENRSVLQKNSIIRSGYPALAVTFGL